MHDDEDDDEDTVLRPRRAPASGAPTAVDETVLRGSASRRAPASAPSALVDDTVLRGGSPRGARAAGSTESVDDTVLRGSGRDRPGTADALDDTVLRPDRGARPGVPTTEDLDDKVLRSRPRPGRTAGTTDASGPDDRGAGLPGRPTPSGRAADAPAPAGPDQGLPAVPAQRERVPSIRVGGRVLRLDRPVVIGRRPSAPRIVRGDEPELVRVPSPRQEVSASHLAVSAAGTAVVVEDLATTNGTVIRPVGAPPIRMPSGGSMVVLTGTVVEIGDGNAIEILSPHLRVHPPAGASESTVPWPSAPEPRYAPTRESDPDT